MNDLMDWLGDVFYKEVTETTVRDGYHTERYSYSGSQALTVQLPFNETVTTTKQVLNGQAVCAAVLVVLTFVTVVTVIREAIFK